MVITWQSRNRGRALCRDNQHCVQGDLLRSNKTRIAPQGKRVGKEACFGRNLAIVDTFPHDFCVFRDCGASQANLRFEKDRIAPIAQIFLQVVDRLSHRQMRRNYTYVCLFVYSICAALWMVSCCTGFTEHHINLGCSRCPISEEKTGQCWITRGSCIPGILLG